MRRTDHYISDSLRRLSNKVYVVAKDARIPEITARKKKNSKLLKDKDKLQPDLFDDGIIIKEGDVIKFGRVPYLIKQSSLDKEKKAIE